jgi:hypothetical protein
MKTRNLYFVILIAVIVLIGVVPASVYAQGPNVWVYNPPVVYQGGVVQGWWFNTSGAQTIYTGPSVRIPLNDVRAIEAQMGHAMATQDRTLPAPPLAPFDGLRAFAAALGF